MTSIVTTDYVAGTTTTETIDYDQIGNPTTYRGATLAFNGRQLTSYNDGTNSIAYTYDASGLRASKTVNGETTIYQYVGDKLYYEQRADGSKHYYFYDSYGNLAKIYRHTSLGKKVYNVVTNAQGDVIALYDFAGVLVCTYEYDAWGNLTSVKNANGAEITSQNHIAFLNPIRYRGYYYDSEIGMYYLQSRYYDPDTGRFINADGYITTGQGVLSYNMFAYCLNNPVMMADHDGKLPKFLKEILSSNYDVPYYNQGESFLCWAYCQVMVEDFNAGIVRTQESADVRARELSMELKGVEDHPGKPENLVEIEYASVWNCGIWKLAIHLKFFGPLYIAYKYEDYKGDSQGHAMLVTGVDLHSGEITTLDPYSGECKSSYDDFVNYMPGYDVECKKCTWYYFVWE